MVFSFDAPQEYSADFVMATLATTSTSDVTTAHQRTTTRPSPAATALTTSARPSISNGRPPAVSINKQQLSTDHCDIAATPPAAISIAETPNKDINPVSWLQEGTVTVEGTNGHHYEEPVTVSSSKPTEEDKKELLPHSHDRETDNLLESLFDDIINDDIADNEYGFTHQHPNSTGNNTAIPYTVYHMWENIGVGILVCRTFKINFSYACSSFANILPSISSE